MDENEQAAAQRHGAAAGLSHMRKLYDIIYFGTTCAPWRPARQPRPRFSRSLGNGMQPRKMPPATTGAEGTGSNASGGEHNVSSSLTIADELSPPPNHLSAEKEAAERPAAASAALSAPHEAVRRAPQRRPGQRRARPPSPRRGSCRPRRTPAKARLVLERRPQEPIPWRRRCAACRLVSS
ncbi:hypothetical protein ZWY2020_038506 [Hordeum vulgare]|nr:hypothetical protein ZWY2020_038506 [Hordeum vulgare]